jgi:hypothetical protein
MSNVVVRKIMTHVQLPFPNKEGHMPKQLNQNKHVTKEIRNEIMWKGEALQVQKVTHMVWNLARGRWQAWS